MLNLKICACVLWQENASTPTQSRKRMGSKWVEKCEQERSGNGRGQDILLASSSYLFKLFREHFKSVRMGLAYKGPIQVRPKCLSFRARWPPSWTSTIQEKLPLRAAVWREALVYNLVSERNTLSPSHQWQWKTRLWHCCRKQTCPDMTCTNTVPCKKFYERLSGRDFPLSFSFLLLLPSVDIQFWDKP